MFKTIANLIRCVNPKACLALTVFGGPVILLFTKGAALVGGAN
tara:strand:- start:827 stop:955 length:129 start_codon:yes stop_codon:yes gene_type:complete